MLQSARVRAAREILESLRANPYLKADAASKVAELLSGVEGAGPAEVSVGSAAGDGSEGGASAEVMATVAEVTAEKTSAKTDDKEEEVPEEAVSAYLAEHAAEIVAEEGKPFQPIGGIMDLLGADYFPVSTVQEMGGTDEAGSAPVGTAAWAAAAKASVATAAGRAAPQTPVPAKRENTMQKINRLDVKGRIQLALKGNKEERSILIRDGTKVVALAVLEAPKLSDGEVEKFALQKNVLEAVLRQIPLKRRFMKNYKVVRNLVSNPRTPLDLGLGLMKHLLAVDLKNISANKEVSETVRSLALKMYKQKVEAANKK
jgi:hypothetical protein